MLSDQHRSLIGAMAFIQSLALVGYMVVGVVCFAGALFSVAYVGGLPYHT